jgi:hypothetical protein
VYVATARTSCCATTPSWQTCSLHAWLLSCAVVYGSWPLELCSCGWQLGRGGSCCVLLQQGRMQGCSWLFQLCFCTWQGYRRQLQQGRAAARLPQAGKPVGALEMHLDLELFSCGYQLHRRQLQQGQATAQNFPNWSTCRAVEHSM